MMLERLSMPTYRPSRHHGSWSTPSCSICSRRSIVPCLATARAYEREHEPGQAGGSRPTHPAGTSSIRCSVIRPTVSSTIDEHEGRPRCETCSSTTCSEGRIRGITIHAGHRRDMVRRVSRTETSHGCTSAVAAFVQKLNRQKRSKAL